MISPFENERHYPAYIKVFGQSSFSLREIFKTYKLIMKNH